MQTGVTVEGDTIKGTLKYIEGGLSPSGPLAGSGYFIALKWDDPDEEATSLKVGLVPSASGMDLVECIEDDDRNGVFKVTDKDNQQLFLVSSNDDHTTKQKFKLSGLTLQTV